MKGCDMKEIKDCSYYYDCCSCASGECGCRYCYTCNRCETCENLDSDDSSKDSDYLECDHIKHANRW